MVGLVSPAAYGIVVGAGVACTAVLLVEARRHPGPWTIWAARAIGTLLLADAVCFVFSLMTQGRFSVQNSLPLPLCDLGAVVAAAACFWRVTLLVELTYFWGLAGTLQAVVTPDLATPFPHLAFFEYTVGHVCIVMAALFLVVGMRITPQPKAVPRVFAITAAYTALVGLVDGLTGADYMFLRAPPVSWSLLSVLGPWPWYVFSATGVALVLLVLLDLPFWRGRPPAFRTGIAHRHSRHGLRLRWPS
jgi:hypothetical integral membrane protein (TIGR02206 family)